MTMPRFKVRDPSGPEFSSRPTLPLGPDELLTLDNEVSNGEAPKALVEGCSDRRVFVTDLQRSKTEIALERLDRTSAGFRLPPGSFLGRAGLTAEYLSEPGDPGAVEPSPPFRPRWSGYLYHPKRTPGPAPINLRRSNGRRMRAHTVYHPDNRSFFQPTDYPLQCIGRLDVKDDPASNKIRASTATLVGPRTIVTAAHCVPRDGSPGKWSALFTPAYFSGMSMAGMSSWCEAYRVRTTVRSDSTQAFDVAVMKLYDPLGEALGWFGSRSYDSDWEDESRWTLIGYPGYAADFNSGGIWPTIENGVRVIDDDPDSDGFAEIEHMGDASDGNSGGPLFGTWPDGPYVIAVHSGHEYRTVWTPFGDIVAENNNVAAGGTGMVEMIRKALADWP
jgi:V8-like Glu-specific endopeptidase